MQWGPTGTTSSKKVKFHQTRPNSNWFDAAACLSGLQRISAPRASCKVAPKMPVIFSFLPESIDIWSTFCKCLCSLREINFVLTTQWARLRSCHVTKKLIKNSYGRKVFSVSIFCLFFFCALSPASEPGPMETPLRLNFTRPKLTSFADSQGQPCLRVSPSEN